jgi:hypothetical protein
MSSNVYRVGMTLFVCTAVLMAPAIVYRDPRWLAVHWAIGAIVCWTIVFSATRQAIQDIRDLQQYRRWEDEGEVPDAVTLQNMWTDEARKLWDELESGTWDDVLRRSDDDT